MLPARYATIRLIARNCTFPEFKEWLSEYCSSYREKNPNAVNHLLRLIEYDGQTIHELSTDQQILVSTIRTFYRILRDEETASRHTDLLEDIIRQLDRLSHLDKEKMTRAELRQRMNRWATGTDERIIAAHEANKKRIIELLIDKIENRSSGKFSFTQEMSIEDKRYCVEDWWNNYRFQLAMAIKSPTELNRYLNNSLTPKVLKTLKKAKEKGIPFFITPYYASLLSVDHSFDDAAIRSYIIYSPELVDAYGTIRAWEREDEVKPGQPNAAGWILPEGHNIHRRYPEVAILIPDSMGRACGGLCASCQRMYNFQAQRLNFDLDELKPKASWPNRLRQLMQFFEEDPYLSDILITGGDALMSQNATLSNILDAVCRMAERKRKANYSLPPSQRKAEMRRIRLGSRLPAYLPMRMDDELIDILTHYRKVGEKAGITQFVIQTHFQSPLELTPQAVDGIGKLLNAGWIVTNQLVNTVASSRMGHAARLRQALNLAGVLTYYTFTVKGFAENYAPFAPNARSLQAVAEEKSYGRLTPTQTNDLCRVVLQKGWNAERMQRFLSRHNLPFAATERNTLNLPGIGKSMTFETIGILDDGRRLLRFEHDTTRRHSPLVEKMPEVFIAENKSIAAYLHQIKEMGEDIKQYRSIWNYTDGQTESRFPLFELEDK